jgi:hypothetical protein
MDKKGLPYISTLEARKVDWGSKRRKGCSRNPLRAACCWSQLPPPAHPWPPVTGPLSPPVPHHRHPVAPREEPVRWATAAAAPAAAAAAPATTTPRCSPAAAATGAAPRAAACSLRLSSNRAPPRTPPAHPPEWPSFLHIPHSPEAVVMGQEVANFFVREARRNKHVAVGGGARGPRGAGGAAESPAPSPPHTPPCPALLRPAPPCPAPTQPRPHTTPTPHNPSTPYPLTHPSVMSSRRIRSPDL